MSQKMQGRSSNNNEAVDFVNLTNAHMHMLSTSPPAILRKDLRNTVNKTKPRVPCMLSGEAIFIP